MSPLFSTPRVADAPGFEELVAARSGPLLSMARGLVRNESDAEDLVQDVLARALVKWDLVTRAGDPAAYVNRMLVNAAMSWWRRPVRRERASDLVGEADGAGSGAGSGPGTAPWGATVVEDPAVGLGDRDALLAALRKLPARHRAVLVLRYYEGLPDREIAALLDMAPATVRSSASRGLIALRRAGLLDGAASPTSR